MKKHIRNIIIVLLLAFVAVSVLADDPTVYITWTGAKYHVGTCRYLSKSKIPISLSDAIARGYTPCSVCRPPTLSSAAKTPPTKAPATPEKSQTQAIQGLYQVNVAALKSYRQADLSRMVLAKVIEHVDGDTVKVSISNPPAGLQPFETIRMLGVDTPEIVHPQKQVEYFGKEASEFTKTWLLGKPVLLAFDWNLRDKYKRLLAYIYLLDGSCYNARLVSEGYAHAYTEFPFQFLEEFRALEREARETVRGLWGSR